jgi:hypothetical protein
MRRITTFTLAALLTASAFGAGEVYRWRGADGSWHYSDQPRPGAELVVGSTRNNPGPEPEQQVESSSRSQVSAEISSNNDIPVSDAVANEVRAAAAAEKSTQCKQAEESYQQALRARRIYKVDAQGKRLADAQGNPVFMTSAEIDQERLQARANRDLACGSGA